MTVERDLRELLARQPVALDVTARVLRSPVGRRERKEGRGPLGKSVDRLAPQGRPLLRIRERGGLVHRTKTNHVAARAGAHRLCGGHHGAELRADFRRTQAPDCANAHRIDQFVRADRREAEKKRHTARISRDAVDLPEGESGILQRFLHGIHGEKQRRAREPHAHLRLADARDVGRVVLHRSFSNRGK